MMTIIELRAGVPAVLARALDRALVTLAEARGVPRVTRQQAIVEAVKLWLDRHQAAGLDPDTAPTTPATPTGGGTAP